MRKGFTLVELLIVILIIAILASIAVPMMRSNVTRAQRTEAIAVLGTIRTAERLYYAERGSYLSVTGAQFNTNASGLNAYISNTDINGRYYNAANYEVATATNNLWAGVTGTAPGFVNMNLITGEITQGD